MTTPDPKHLAYLESLREAQRRRGERARAERDRAAEPEPEQPDEPAPELEEQAGTQD